ncbi:hypothetical protein OS965_39595 [Streptomyces sp. H27-G5]|uniref:hypothetical protein n=1 Tax=Streptomyces sp. H27-G5 TaxID=2996698 RepID=UPI00226F781A|nr:hypothetical protein [Streptomyces sp. H27-G5]MCY0924148.1 hypothetical protein [Streptomyces sp. H27-G5]
MDLVTEAIWEDPDHVVVLWLDGIESDCLDSDHEAFRQILATLLEAGGEWPADAPVEACTTTPTRTSPAAKTA